MAWSRLLQLGRPLSRSPIVESTPVWCRSFSSSMETFGQASHVVKQESGNAQAMGAGEDAVVCGRGDKKTKRGKRFKHSFGWPREKRGTRMRWLREKWQIPYDPLLPPHLQPFPPPLQ